LKSKKLFVDRQTYGRTYGQTDILYTLLHRLRGVELKRHTIELKIEITKEK